MNFKEFKLRRLNDEQKAKALELLGITNKLLVKWHKVFSDLKFRNVRNLVLDRHDVLLLNLPQEKHAEFLNDICIIRQIRAESAEFDGRSVETAILQNYAMLAKKHALKWYKNSHGTGLALDDFLQEAYMQIMESMFRWSPDNGADLTTYLYWSLKNRMSNVANQQGSMLSHMTNASLSLLNKFNKTKANMEVNTSIGDVADKMELSDEQRYHLQQIMNRMVVPESSAMYNPDQPDDAADYTAARVNIDQDRQMADSMEEVAVKEILDKSNLNPMERELIETAMNPFYGWQTEIGKRFISQRTGRPFGRMRVGQILERAREKVARVLSKQ